MPLPAAEVIMSDVNLRLWTGGVAGEASSYPLSAVEMMENKALDVIHRLRLAELMAALSLATDLGMGQPLEQTIRTCLMAIGVAQRLGMGAEESSNIYYVALLRFLGCTADAHEAAAMAGGDEIALRAAIAPVLGAPNGEFMATVIPKVGAGLNPLRRVGTVANMLRTGQ